MPLHKTQPAGAAATSTSPALPVGAIEEVDGPTGTVQVAKNEIFEKPAWSSSPRGLSDLVTHVNKTTTVYTRRCSVSLPLGLGIVPHGSKTERLRGQRMAEILEVHANFPFVGTIMVCDRFSCKTLYHKEGWKRTYRDYSSREDQWLSGGNPAAAFKHKLELTGPSRATTADSGFVIKVYIPARKRKNSEICRLLCGTGDIGLHNQLQTRTIVTSRGCLFVTYSVLPEALEGYVEVLLQLPSHWRGAAGATIYGFITARIEKFNIASTLFIKDLKEAAVALEASPDNALCSEESYSCMRVPLTRSALAVPIGEYLQIEGKLQVCGYDAMPITIDHRIAVDCEKVSTPWIKSGESSSAVRMWLGPIF